MTDLDDIQRLRKEYSRREQYLSGRKTYSYFNKASLFTIQQRERAILDILYQKEFDQLDDQQILEIGCGSGGVLTQLLSYGAVPQKIHGIDLLYNRLTEALQKLKSSYFINTDGQFLPYPENTFSLIIQFTAFSSILDDQIKHNMATEMLRVLRPDGAVLWYDFWLNPTNKQTRGIHPPEIQNLFPDCSFEFHKITLAPPIARFIAPVSWGLALLLESLKIFNTHYLAFIRKLDA